MINIILSGAAGRMGHAVLDVLPNFKELELIAAIEAAGHPELGKKVHKNVKLTHDIAGHSGAGRRAVLVDFSTTGSAITNLKAASAAKIPAVVGVTGFNAEQKGEISAMSRSIPIVWSPNMSIGVNVMWRLIEDAATFLGKDYQIDIVETHHVHKKDAPSGTAKKMIEIVAERGGYHLKKDVFFHAEGSGGVIPEAVIGDLTNTVKCGGSPLNAAGMTDKKAKIKVRSIREGEVVGDHTIIFTSPYERLEVTHRAFSRGVFANGALRAALWVAQQKPGLYEMKDVLSINV